MSKWLKILLFAIILGIAKAHNFVKLVILAGLGLAGLWMVHTLAQDFQNIQEGGSFNLNNHNDLRTNNGGGGGGGGGGLGVNLFKRSIPEPKARPNSINWELVLSRDPASCARSFLCQLAALDEKTLSKDEKLMLSLVRSVHNYHVTAIIQFHWSRQVLRIG